MRGGPFGMRDCRQKRPLVKLGSHPGKRAPLSFPAPASRLPTEGRRRDRVRSPPYDGKRDRREEEGVGLVVTDAEHDVVEQLDALRDRQLLAQRLEPAVDLRVRV